MKESINHYTEDELKALAVISVDLEVKCDVAARVHLMSDREADAFAEYYRLYSMS